MRQLVKDLKQIAPPVGTQEYKDWLERNYDVDTQKTSFKKAERPQAAQVKSRDFLKSKKMAGSPLKNLNLT